ncbi:MAG: ABC transporter permease [Bdellovibrio sp.]|nr:ABC transporter permease [Bdellovibrio sp.]
MASKSSRLRPGSSWFARGMTAFGFLLLYIPLVTLMVYSFLTQATGGLEPRQWTLEWYRLLWNNTEVLAALEMSLYVGFWSTLGATVLGTSAALALTRARFPGRQVFDVFTYIPLIMPEIVLGIAMLIWFVMLRMTLGSLSIILAHITFCMSYVIIAVKARLHGFDYSLEEAARDLGATPFQTFWRVTFPLIWPGVLSGALMAFTLSFDDFLITFFTAGVGSDTLPLKIYSMIKFGVSPEINALSTLIMLATFVLVGLIYRPLKRG